MKRKATDSYTKLPFEKYKKHKIKAIQKIADYFHDGNIYIPYTI